MLGRTDSRRRLLVLLTIFVIGSLALIARTAYWQVLNGDFLLARAAAQTTVRIEVAGRRGDIYDRTGTVLLATTINPSSSPGRARTVRSARTAARARRRGRVGAGDSKNRGRPGKPIACGRAPW